MHTGFCGEPLERHKKKKERKKERKEKRGHH